MTALTCWRCSRRCSSIRASSCCRKSSLGTGDSATPPRCPLCVPSVSPHCSHRVPTLSPRCPHCVPLTPPQCPPNVPLLSPQCPLAVPPVSPCCPPAVPSVPPVSPPQVPQFCPLLCCPLQVPLPPQAQLEPPEGSEVTIGVRGHQRGVKDQQMRVRGQQEVRGQQLGSGVNV